MKNNTPYKIIYSDSNCKIEATVPLLIEHFEQGIQQKNAGGNTLDASINIYSLPLHFNKQLKGSHGGDAIPDIEIPRLINLLKVGKMTLDGLITHEFLLDEINIALDTMRKGDCGRIIINM